MTTDNLKYMFEAGVKISDTTVAHLLATNSTHQYVKCVDIYPHSEQDILLAVGQANGKVILSSFGSSIFDVQGLSGKELSISIHR